jgi:hypothetical protein
MKGKFRRSTSPRRLAAADDIMQLKKRYISFVNNVKYLGVTSDKRMAWRHHVERTVAKILGTYIKDIFSIRNWAFKYKY